MYFRIVCVALSTLLYGVLVAVDCKSAQELKDVKTIPLKFKPGETSATVSGSVKGYLTNDYKFRAKGGQTLKAKLTSKNSSLYFNILGGEHQNDGVALELEPRPVSVTEWQGKLPKDDDFVIRVYLYRSAARRGTTASYSLSVEIN